VKISKILVCAFILAFTLGLGLSANAATIQALKVSGNIPGEPTDPFWSNYGPLKGKFNGQNQVIIDMEPQMITNPMWPAPSTKYVFVKAVNNGKEIAVRLEWLDPTRNDIMVRSQQYKDQAAIMFPVNQSGEEPPFTMGGDGERVNIWQWKATWDKEGAGSAGNAGMQDMEDVYDNMVMGSGSYYMYEPGSKSSNMAQINGTPGTKEAWRKNQGVQDISKRSSHLDFGMGKNEGAWNPGRYTGNMLSDASMRKSAVEDLNAEGFSTLTTQAHQDVDGGGNWNNNRWVVVYKRSLTNGDSNDTQFKGSKTPMAIAIWNGQNKERNGQKAVTQWNELRY
jgi:DMSO reductase family type II enzyme heme b subunit